MQKILQLKLRFLAKMYLRRYKPMIIAVTGNAGKTSTKEIIGAVVKRIKTIRVSGGNLNNEIGVPLTILGNWSNEYYERGSSIWFWIKVLIVGVWNLIFPTQFPEVLLLEYGADHPGDIARLVRDYPPHIGVVTTVGDIPVHVEFFKDAEGVAFEKSQLIRNLTATDFAILNHDDDRVLDMARFSKGKVLSYGFDIDATVYTSDFEYRSAEDGVPIGVVFKLHHKGSFAPITIDGSLGRSQAQIAAAAAAVGISLGMNLVTISQALAHYYGPKGRLKIIPGISGSTIIDDTYNASPASTRLALETLRDVPGIRKVAVLGDMLELGEHTVTAHQNIGSFAATFVDLLICVGSRAKFIAAAASDQMPQEKILTFETSDQAQEVVPTLIKQYDLVLIKGSQGARMEKVVKSTMADPLHAKTLLVRQSRAWLLH